MSLNPVRARLVARPQDWAWSSARAHLAAKDDGLAAVRPVLERLGPGGIEHLLQPSADDDAAFAVSHAAQRRPAAHLAMPTSSKAWNGCSAAP